MDQSPGSFIVRPVITDQVSNEDVAVNAVHQRDSCPMGTAFLPFLCRSPARSDTCLFFTRMTTTPSGINVNVILSPALIPRWSRIGLGIVVCPLLVSVASVLMAISGILTYITVVRNGCLCKLASNRLLFANPVSSIQWLKEHHGPHHELTSQYEPMGHEEQALADRIRK
jgi:hypothetical protein